MRLISTCFGVSKSFAPAWRFGLVLMFCAGVAAAQPPSTPPVTVPKPPTTPNVPYGPSGRSGSLLPPKTAPTFTALSAPAAPAVPANAPPPTEPPQWFQRTNGPAPDMQFGPWQIQPTTLGELYLRADAGFHRELGFPEREGVGFEGIGRVYVPQAPWFSVIGELRDEILTEGNRLTWTVGGVAEFDLYKAAAGIDGIYDTESSSHVGSAFLYLSRELPELNSYFGFWTTFGLWDDTVVTNVPIGPFLGAQNSVGVKPLEQFSLFYAARLGIDGQWGELYVAPGWEMDLGEFQFSAGYQVTVAPNVDVFANYYQMAGTDHNWSLYAGVQYHLGCGPSRPFDFVMPNRIRARQRWGVDSTVFLFD